jgi:NAD(P)-dependent dehydrogenase (short-subunit alcohol dehydrogenase family)
MKDAQDERSNAFQKQTARIGFPAMSLTAKQWRNSFRLHDGAWPDRLRLQQRTQRRAYVAGWEHERDFLAQDHRRLSHLSLPLQRNQTPPMLSTGGGVTVNNSSVDGLRRFPGGAAYAAAKHGVSSPTKSVALEYARDGLKITAICPGGVNTSAVESFMKKNAAVADQITGQTPIGRIATPSEIADGVLWLAPTPRLSCWEPARARWRIYGLCPTRFVRKADQHCSVREFHGACFIISR